MCCVVGVVSYCFCAVYCYVMVVAGGGRGLVCCVVCGLLLVVCGL